MTIGELVGRVVLDARGFVTGINAVTGHSHKAAMAFGMLGMAAGAASYGIIRGLGGVVKASADFEYGMRRVNTINLLADDSLKQMSKDVQKLGIQFGKMPGELANALYDIASATFFGAEGMQVLDASTKAAIAGMTEVQIAAKAITGILNAYGMSGKDAAHVSDVLFTAVKYGVVTFRELANEIGQAASTAALVGVPLEDVAAAFATITRAGITASEAGVSINRAMLAYIKPAAAARKEAAALGIDLSATALASKGLKGAIDELVTKLGITEKQLDRVLTSTGNEREALELLAVETGLTAEALADLFVNVRALRAILPLVRQDTRGFSYDMEQMGEASGATQEALNEMLKTLRVQWLRVKAAFQAFLADAGEPMLGVLKRLTQHLLWVLNAARQLPPWFFKVAFIVGGVSAGIFSLTSVVSGLVFQFMMIAPAIQAIIPSLTGAAGVGIAGSAIAAGVGVSALVGALAALGVAYKQTSGEAEDLNELFETQFLQARKAGVTLPVPIDLTTTDQKMAATAGRMGELIGLENKWTKAVWERYETNQRSLDAGLEALGLEGAATEAGRQRREEEARGVATTNRVIVAREKLREIEDSMVDEFYPQYLQKMEQINKEFEEIRLGILGGEPGEKLVKARAEAGQQALTDAQYDALVEMRRLRKKAIEDAGQDYITQVKEQEARAQQEVLQKMEETEREKLQMAELFAEYGREVAQETFAQFEQRIRLMIQYMREADAERKKVGMKPFYTRDVLQKEIELYRARVQESERVTRAIEEEAKARQATAKAVVDALRDEEKALKDIVDKQEDLVDHLLEMGDITVAEWAGHLQRILRMLEQIDQARRKWGEDPSMLRERWAIYEKLHDKQVKWGEELKKMDEKRMDDWRDFVKEMKDLNKTLQTAADKLQDRAFDHRREQVKALGLESEDEQYKLAQIDLAQAQEMMKAGIPEGADVDMLDEIADRWKEVVSLLEAAAETLGPKKIGTGMETASNMLDEIARRRVAVAKKEVDTLRETEDAAARKHRTEKTALTEKIDVVGEALKARVSEIGTAFYNEFAARIKDLGKVLVGEFGRGGVAAQGAPGALAATGAGAITINIGAGGIRGNEREIIQKVIAALTNELTRARR